MPFEHNEENVIRTVGDIQRWAEKWDCSHRKAYTRMQHTNRFFDWIDTQIEKTEG